MPLRGRLELLERQVRQSGQPVQGHLQRQRYGGPGGPRDRGLRGQHLVVLDRQLQQRLVADRSVHGGWGPLLVHERLAVSERHPVRDLVGMRVGRLHGERWDEQRIPLRPVMARCA